MINDKRHTKIKKIHVKDMCNKLPFAYICAIFAAATASRRYIVPSKRMYVAYAAHMLSVSAIHRTHPKAAPEPSTSIGSAHAS